MSSLVRLGNTLGVAGIALVLLMAFGAQFALKELPCPLCLLQRVAFTMCGFGFLLNLRFGSQPLHYGVILLGALFGTAAAGRHVLLHIVPGSGSYGSPLLGLHYYTWSLLLFLAVIVAVAVLLILSGGGRPEHDRFDTRPAARFSGIARLAAYLLVGVTLANVANSVVECGFGECSDNPTSYWLLQRF
jgi:disulfide bond formation protein DsbB